MPDWQMDCIVFVLFCLAKKEPKKASPLILRSGQARKDYIPFPDEVFQFGLCATVVKGSGALII